MRKNVLASLLFVLASAGVASAQSGELMPQHYFKQTVPAGNYSGLTWLGGDRYAVVNDKAPADGFDIFAIDINSSTGEISNVRKIKTLTSGFSYGRDSEGIAYFPKANTVFISGEADNKIMEYSMDGKLTGRQIALPPFVVLPRGNYGLESLTYNASTHRFWTTTESTLPVDGNQANAVNGISNHLRLMSFDDNLAYQGAIDYIMDTPLSTKQARYYANGVSALCALDDGQLLVLEREAFVAKGYMGSWVVNRVYSVNTKGPALPQKRLVAMWRTSFNLIHKDFANYEGMCAGPHLANGRQVIVLCADSQNQEGKLLRDWFRTIVL